MKWKFESNEPTIHPESIYEQVADYVSMCHYTLFINTKWYTKANQTNSFSVLSTTLSVTCNSKLTTLSFIQVSVSGKHCKIAIVIGDEICNETICITLTENGFYLLMQ